MFHIFSEEKSMKKLMFMIVFVTVLFMVFASLGCENATAGNPRQSGGEGPGEDPIEWGDEKPVEGWELNNGGIQTTLPSSVEETAAVNKWGVWLNNYTFGCSLDFSTEGSYVSAANTKANLNGDFTVSLWLMAPQRENADRVILMLGSAEGNNHKLFLDSTDDFKLTYQASGIGGIENSGISLTDGKWHHIALSRSEDTLRYYVDKVVVKTLTVNGTSACASGDVYIGADSNGNNGFDGTISEARIYDKALLPAQVTWKTLDSRDNMAGQPRLDIKKGLTFDRRQYWQPEPLPNEGQTVRAQDIYNAKMMGFDHVKLLLTPNHLITQEGNLISGNMFYIESVVNYVVNNGFRCIVCLHPEQDFKPNYLGGNLSKFEILVKWYGEFAQWVGGHWSPDVVAIQLMTEPGANDETISWSWMSDRLWGAVRNVLPNHTIITSSDRYGNLERLKLMSPASDSNLIYSFTTYEPYTIGWYYYNPEAMTYWGYIKDIPYPVVQGVNYTQAIEDAIDMVPPGQKTAARKALQDYVAGICDGERTNFPNIYYPALYNAEWHRLRAASLGNWRQKYGGNIHIMCVEFGCMDRLTPVNLWHTAVEGSGIPDADRIQFVHDTRAAFDEYDIRWAYWSYNEAHTVFLPEKHVYGTSPEFNEAITMFDWDMLKTGLGLIPLILRPDPLVVEILRNYNLPENWQGHPSMTIAGPPGPPSGGQYLSVTGSADIVFVNPSMVYDLSAFTGDGILHLEVYASNPSLIHGGQIEFSSSGEPDINEYHFGEFGSGISLTQGWNELNLPFVNLITQGAPPNMGAINYIRIYFNVSGGSETLGIANIHIYHEP
jgi:hypothetical protein